MSSLLSTLIVPMISSFYSIYASPAADVDDGGSDDNNYNVNNNDWLRPSDK